MNSMFKTGPSLRNTFGNVNDFQNGLSEGVNAMNGSMQVEGVDDLPQLLEGLKLDDGGMEVENKERQEVSMDSCDAQSTDDENDDF